MADDRFDTIIVGGGPAGCVLAARLSEDADRSVLLIEAGPDYGADVTSWPADMLDPARLAPDTHSWNYYHAADVNDRRLQLPRARVMGGSTTVNGAMWIRGSQIDYDEWARLGNPGWDFQTLLPYFKKIEADPAGDPDVHGQTGPVTIGRVADDVMSALDRAFIETAQELGFEWTDDINLAPSQEPSVGKTPKNLSDGNRLNSALSYLALARDRPNLKIVPDSLIDRVLVEGRQATGILTADGREYHGREVVVCSGAYGSPAVLLRSGIGPAGELRDLGIEPVVDLPGVGRNLMDHPQIARQSGLTAYVAAPDYPQTGPTLINTMLKARSSQSTEEIDIHFYPGEAVDPETGHWILAFGVSLQYARSKGRVRLTSRDPEAELDIDHNYFSDPADLEAICDGYELLMRFTSTPPLSRLFDRPLRDGPHRHDREALKAAVITDIGTTYHPSTTCKMGPASDPLAVVDSACRVRGMAGLRVVDASVFPFGPRANLHYTVCAVAERVAALMRAEGTAS